jgi:hypothetical protein
VIRALRFLLVVLAVAAPLATAASSLPPAFERLERALRLTPEQKRQFDVAVTATRRIGVVVAMTGLEFKDRIAEELAKPRPDLRILFDAKDEIVARSRELRREAREEWLKLYEMLDAEQVATLKSFAEARVDHLGALHEFMVELILGRSPSKRKVEPYYW